MTLLTRLVEKLFSHKILVQHNLNIPWDHFHLAKEPDIMLLTHLFQAARSSLLCLWLCSCAGRAGCCVTPVLIAAGQTSLEAATGSVREVSCVSSTPAVPEEHIARRISIVPF